MSENLEEEYTAEFTKQLLDRYRKAISENNDTFVKQKMLIRKLWAKIAELIETPEDLADFINEVYE